MNLHLYALAINRPLSNGERDALANILPYPRFLRLMRTRENKQDQALCAYGLLRFGVEQIIGAADLPEIKVAEGGKPYFSKLPQLHFNISHTEGGVLCGLYDSPVGVDIERDREAAEAVRRYYHMPTQKAFWEMWVRHEAVAKYHGVGVSVLPHWDETLEQGVVCRNVSVLDGFFAAVAAGTNALVEPHVIPLEEMLDGVLLTA